MRLFFAVNFTDNTRSRLISLRDELRAHSSHGSFSSPENLHLTLVFLGECNMKQLSAAKAALAEISLGSFDININCIGRFKRDRGDIWWAGIEKNKALLLLQNSLAEKLVTKGFKLEQRSYHPHVTLGREVITDTQPKEIKPFGETVKSVDLMKSERIQGKLVYTLIMKNSI